MKEYIIELSDDNNALSILLNAYNLRELVRCKDCDNRECDGRAGTIVCGITGESHSRLWFCAGGERKENVLYHCNCPYCGKDWWSENAFPHECLFCGKELT